MSRSSDIAAIRAAIDAQFASPVTVEIDDAAKRTSDYIIVFLSRRYVEGRLISGESRTDGWRLVTRYVAKKSAANVRVLQDRTRAAIEEKFLPDGAGPFSFETEQEPLAYDSDGGGWFTTADAWVS